MARMLYDIERSKVIKFVDNEANIINKLKGKAKSTNHSNIMKHFEQMAKRMNEGEDPDKWVTAEDMYRRTLNKKQAMDSTGLQKWQRMENCRETMIRSGSRLLTH